MRFSTSLAPDADRLDSPAVSPPKARVPLVAALVAVLLVAAALRFGWIDRYPLGWHHDEALMGVMAGQVYRGEQRPIFFREFLGQEPLYIYASAAAMALVGGDEGVLPLRLTSAAFGLLTVALTFALVRSMLGARVGLLSAALVAASFWQVMSSREGYRSITQPFAQALAVYFLWQCYRRRGAVWFALAGAALGGAFYTYLGARVFPLVFLGFAAWLLLTGRRPSRAVLARCALLVGAAVLVAAPLAEFFLTNPGTFSARTGQVAILQPGEGAGHVARLLAGNLIKLLSTFTFVGDSPWRFNLPGRPMFVGALVLCFYGGLIALARRLGKLDDAAALIGIWLASMLFPSVLSLDNGTYSLREMGLVPAIFVVPALGLAWLWQWIERRQPPLARAAIPVVAAVLVVEAAWTARDYFLVWAPSFGASYESSADAVASARFLMANAHPDREDVFVGTDYYHHPVLAQLARPVYPALRWFDGAQSVVFDPQATRPALYVLGFNGMPRDVDALFPRADLVGEEMFASGIDGSPPPPLFLAYRLAPADVRAEVARLTADPRLRPVAGRVPGVLTPLGGRVDGPVAAGHDLGATLIWRIDGTLPPGDYQLGAQLVDHDWQTLADVEGLGYPTPEWRPGDVVVSQLAIPVPAALAPGLDKVQVFFYNRQTGQRLPVDGGLPGIQALVLGDVRVTGPPPPAPAHPIGARLGADVTLVGADSPHLTDDHRLDVTVDWVTARTPDQDYTVFVQLLDSNGKLVAQSDGFPAAGALPTSSWLPGEVVSDAHHLPLPPGLSRGQYRLIAGMYLSATGQRLPVAGGGDFVDLGPVRLPP